MCWDCWDGKADPHKEFIRGGVDPDFGEVEVNYQTRMKGRNKSRRVKTKTRPGCAGNDYGPHVYVWTTERAEKDFFSDWFGFPKYERRICCGCGKSNGSRESERYLKIKERKWNKLPDFEKGVPFPRFYRGRRAVIRFSYWTWENEDEAYTAARREYINKHGWDRHIYGSHLWY